MKADDRADAERGRITLVLLNVRADEEHFDGAGQRRAVVQLGERSQQRNRRAEAVVKPSCVHQTERARGSGPDRRFRDRRHKSMRHHRRLAAPRARIFPHDEIRSLLADEDHGVGGANHPFLHGPPDRSLPRRGVGAVRPRIAEMRHPGKAGDLVEARADEMIGPGLRERNQSRKSPRSGTLDSGADGASYPYPRRIGTVAQPGQQTPARAHGEPFFRRRDAHQIDGLRRRDHLAVRRPVRSAAARRHTDRRRLPPQRRQLTEHARHLHTARSVHRRHLPADSQETFNSQVSTPGLVSLES